MAFKRTFDKEDHQGNDDRDLQGRAKRRHGDPQLDHAMNLLISAFEPTIRKLMEENFALMVQRLMPQCCQSCPNQQGGTFEGRRMQLCFVNRLPRRIYTLANLTAEDGGPLQIELRYAASQQRVVTEQFSNMKIRICVLDGVFGSDDGNEDWSAEEFNTQIKKPRKGKGPLLRGDTVVQLQNGVASIPIEIAFTDVSITTGNKMFRLGVQSEKSNSLIREGRSEPFQVMDKRGEGYEKIERPALNDKLWRLRHIGKGGPIHRQLSNNGIKTVKDLLRSNTTGSLQKNFGNINTLDKIIKHARNYQDDDDERYIYHAKEPSIPLSIVFNCIYEIVEVIFLGQGHSVQSLNLMGKSLVERAKKEAYKNLKDLEPYETTEMMRNIEPAPYDAPDQVLQYLFDPQAQEQGDLFASYFNAEQWMEEESFSFHHVGEAASSNPLFTALYIPTKGKKSKTVWQKVRNIFKWIIPAKLPKY